MEIFRVSDSGVGPQQVYMTTAYEGTVKDKDNFHMHKRQTDFFTCIKGVMKLVLVDSRAGSGTKGEINEFKIGEDEPRMIKIPNGVLHAFKSVKGEAIVINCIDYEYNRSDPDEFRVKNSFYDWDKLCTL